MPDLWMPGVERHDTGRRLTMRGGPRLFTWHTFEAPYSLTMNAAWRYLRSQKSDPHFVFHPITGEIVQMLPMNTGGRTLRAPGVNTNTHGTVHAQVEVIAYAKNPWTDDLTPAGIAGLTRLMNFLRSWGIPDQWSHGVRPPRYPGGSVRRIQPTQSGHFHHAGWVGNDHGDPGAIDDPWTLVDLLKPVEPIYELTEIHRMLLALGFTADEQGVRNYQTSRGLTVDGIAGPITAKHLGDDVRTIDDVYNYLKHHIGLDLSASEKADIGTSRDLALKQLVTLDAKRTKVLMDRQWDVIKATDAVVDALKGRGVSLDASDVAAVKAALTQED